MGYICPECQTGKHQNCDGVGYVNDNNIFFICACEEGVHPARSPQYD